MDKEISVNVGGAEQVEIERLEKEVGRLQARIEELEHVNDNVHNLSKAFSKCQSRIEELEDGISRRGSALTNLEDDNHRLQKRIEDQLQDVADDTRLVDMLENIAHNVG